MTTTHPKKIAPNEVYSPDCWKFENSYYEIAANCFGQYWATRYVMTNKVHGRGYCAIIINDKAAKSFTSLVKKVEVLIDRYERKA